MREKYRIFKENFLEAMEYIYEWDTDELKFHFRFKEANDGIFDFICYVDIIEDESTHLHIEFRIDEEDGIAVRRFNNTSATDSLAGGMIRLLAEFTTY